MTTTSRASRSSPGQGLWERTRVAVLESLPHSGSSCCGLSMVSSGGGSWEVPSSANLLRLRPRDPGRPYEALTGDSKSTSTSWYAPGSCSKGTAGCRPACTHPERLPGRLDGLADGSCNDADARQWGGSDPERLPGRLARQLAGLGDGSCNDADARQWGGSGERVSTRHCCVGGGRTGGGGSLSGRGAWGSNLGCTSSSGTSRAWVSALPTFAIVSAAAATRSSADAAICLRGGVDGGAAGA